MGAAAQWWLVEIKEGVVPGEFLVPMATPGYVK
jgi:hypothetical protein